ncbi:uncharacterized protein LOC130994967 [Salvia miltiorrhiza]|uniref:uncharacterized protein LOC130994967 n=1 Tax=Salvia miltiorrhiza TaxID=226208 RepID=UPI0025ABCB18|nr:uncharacterized protein LOC130994967 [Salvia miltiorrhiza]
MSSLRIEKDGKLRPLMRKQVKMQSISTKLGESQQRRRRRRKKRRGLAHAKSEAPRERKRDSEVVSFFTISYLRQPWTPLLILILIVAEFRACEESRKLKMTLKSPNRDWLFPQKFLILCG